MPIAIRFPTLLLALTSVLILSACSSEVKDTHPNQLVTQRKAIFKQFTKTLEPMGMVARGRKDYNPREFNINALELQKLTSQPWALFTADSNYQPTLAKPAVWEKPAEFKLAQDKFQVTIASLVQASQGSDLDTIKSAVDAVQKSCKGCHDQFRNER
jgi:cytochrome c556